MRGPVKLSKFALLMGLVNLILLAIAFISIFGTFPDHFFPFLSSSRSVYRSPYFLSLLGALFPLTLWIVVKKGIELIRAPRGQWASWSGILIHLGFLMVLVGGACTLLFAEVKDVMIPEGQTFALPHTQAKLKLEKFTILLHPATDKVKEYISRFLVEEKPGVISRRALRVNHPLNIQGTKIFQMRYQMRIKSVEIFVLEGEKRVATFNLTPQVPFLWNDGGVPVRLRVEAVVPDFVINEKGEYTTRSPIFRNPAALLSFHDAREPDRMKWIFKDAFSHQPAKKQERSFVIGSISKFYESGIKLSRDPGVWPAYLGFLFLVMGTFISSCLVPRFQQGIQT
ncbi:MAG: cytochrome c biogenesis protein ResB [Candidatus Omnitrophica bacterium]|nr:cytochrome c biogenesis protein ResB [Candidatus Omnitrophota bacterium]